MVRVHHPRMLSQNAIRRIHAHLPLKRDIIDWSPTKLMAFLNFVEFFTEEGKFKCDVPHIEAARRQALETEWWDEFMARIGVDTSMAAGKFAKRFISLARVPLSWLKTNPHAVTPEMLAIMKANPRMSWASASFKTEMTDMGVEIVVLNHNDNTDAGLNNPTHAGDVQTPMLRFQQAQMNLLSLLVNISKDFSPADLKKMSVKDRIMAFDKLMNTATKMMGAGRPNSVIFQQINVNKAGRDELEKSFLAYAESQQPQ